MTHTSRLLLAAGLVSLALGPAAPRSRAQADADWNSRSAFLQVMEHASGQPRVPDVAGRAVAGLASAGPAAETSDRRGVRQRLRSLAVSVARTCDVDGPRYALQPVSAELGPVLWAAGDSLASDYLYPLENGLQLSLAGDVPGAALTVRSAQGEPRLLGTFTASSSGPGPCWPYPMSMAELRLADGVAATISLAPRTGILRPACYKDAVNGFYKLDVWAVLSLSFPQETMTIKAKDSRSFPDRDSCRAFHARIRDPRNE